MEEFLRRERSLARERFRRNEKKRRACHRLEDLTFALQNNAEPRIEQVVSPRDSWIIARPSRGLARDELPLGVFVVPASNGVIVLYSAYR